MLLSTFPIRTIPQSSTRLTTVDNSGRGGNAPRKGPENERRVIATGPAGGDDIIIVRQGRFATSHNRFELRLPTEIFFSRDRLFSLILKLGGTPLKKCTNTFGEITAPIGFSTQLLDFFKIIRV